MSSVDNYTSRCYASTDQSKKLFLKRGCFVKNLIVLVLFSTVGINAFANSAKIHATDADEKKVVFALDSKNTPRIDGDSKSYPTIKDFREGSEYYDVCYEGTLKDTRELLNELVQAANGDGDSWADLKSIKKNVKNVLEVVAIITDESGKSEEVYSFSPCK